jgi:hypothetical protein
MNALITSVSNTWTALVFGALFNVLTASANETLIYYTIKTVIGGVIWLGFQLLADYFKQHYAKEEKDERKNGDQNKAP